MRKLFQKATALVLAVALVFASGITAFAADGVELDTLVPIREVFESAGGEVGWDSANRRITASLDGDLFIFYPTTTRAYRNGEAVTLSRPVTIVESTAKIAMNDLLALFGVELQDHLPLTLAQAVEVIPAIMEQFAIPGITIAVVDAQTGFTWAQGFGYADSLAGIPVNGHTLFALASISKPFTAIAVMQLVEAGLINLDTPVVYYLPEFSTLPDVLSGTGDYTNITVRMLLSHASGINPDFIGSGVFTTSDYYAGFMDNFLENLAEMAMAAPEEFQFAYANNAFTLLGLLVAAVGTEYDSLFEGFVAYTQENIFDRAGMNLSTFMLSERHMPYMSQSYARTGAQERFVYFNALPTGGLISNAYDMARFMHIILNEGALPEGGRLLNAGTVRQMFTPQTFELGSGIDFMIPNMQPGLGFVYATGLTGFVHSGHSGNLVHFHSDMAFDRDTGLGVFVSVNSISGMPVVRDIALFVLQNAIYEKTGSLNLPASDPAIELIEVDFADLQALEGVFTNVGGAEFLRVRASEEGFLYMYGILPEPMNLVPMSNGSFLCPATTLTFWFEDIEGETAVFLGEFKSLLIGVELNLEYFAAPEGFERWIGVYYLQLPAGQVSNLYRLEVGIDENGIGFTMTSTLNQVTAISPLLMFDDYNFLGGSFSEDDDGTWLNFVDGRFLRVE